MMRRSETLRPLFADAARHPPILRSVALIALVGLLAAFASPRVQPLMPTPPLSPSWTQAFHEAKNARGVGARVARA